MSVTIKTKPFNYPNFLILEVPGREETVSISVGDALPSDQAAEDYWNAAKAGWIQHVKEKRAGNAPGSQT